MKEILEKIGGHSPLGPLEGVFVAVGEELGNFLDKAIDRIFDAFENKKDGNE